MIRQHIISLFPFDHFHLHPLTGLIWWVLLRSCHKNNNPQLLVIKNNNNNNPQLLVIRQHEAIAAANVPSVFETLPGWDQHQVLGKRKSWTRRGSKVLICQYSIFCVATSFMKADLNAVLALQGISPGQNAHDAAIARWSSFSSSFCSTKIKTKTCDRASPQASSSTKTLQGSRFCFSIFPPSFLLN